MKITVIASNGSPCECEAEDVLAWLIQQVRTKVAAVTIPTGEGEAPGPAPSFRASPIPIVECPINSAKDLTKFLRRYGESPLRRFRFTFPKCIEGGAVYLHGNIPKAKKPVVESSAWTITYPSGKYDSLAEYLKSMIKVLEIGDEDQDGHGIHPPGIGTVAVALEDPFKISKEAFGSFPFTPEPEIEHDRSIGAIVLPEVSLMVSASAVVHLDPYWSFICLDIVALYQFPAHASATVSFNGLLPRVVLGGVRPMVANVDPRLFGALLIADLPRGRGNSEYQPVFR